MAPISVDRDIRYHRRVDYCILIWLLFYSIPPSKVGYVTWAEKRATEIVRVVRTINVVQRTPVNLAFFSRELFKYIRQGKTGTA